MEQLIPLISNVGFPIAISAYLLIRIEAKIENLSTCIGELARVLDNKEYWELTAPPGNCKIIPEQTFEYLMNGVNIEVDPTQDRLVSTKEACQMLGVSAKTLRRWSRDGFISHYETVGGHMRYSKKQLLEFLQKSFVKATNEPLF